MPWQPDRDLELAVQKVLVRAREQTAIWSRDERQRVERDAARRGVTTIHGIDAVKREELSRCGTAAIRDVLEFFRRVYGEVPIDATTWIQQTINDLIDGLVGSLTGELEEARTRMQIPTAGAGEEVQRIGAEVKRDLDIELSTIRLRARHRLTVVGDICGDFLALAREALKRNDADAQNVAAVLVAAAFEDTIRKMGEMLAGVQERPDLANVLEGLKKAGVMLGPQFTNAQGYLTFRNHALHAEWSKIDKSTISSCLAFVDELLTQHFR